MENIQARVRGLAYVEIYSPMAKLLAYWHTSALGFKMVAYMSSAPDEPGRVSYVLKSEDICLVLTSSFPVKQHSGDNEVSDFVSANYLGVKRVALAVNSVTDAFRNGLENGAVPISLPTISCDDFGQLEEAAIRLYDSCEIVFINSDDYRGVFKPGFLPFETSGVKRSCILKAVDHIAGELRVNEMDFWTRYLAAAVGTSLVQSISTSAQNTTGMELNICKIPGVDVTFVMAQPAIVSSVSKVQQNIERFGPGIHHLAFSTDDIFQAINCFLEQGVEFVSFPASYYTLLRQNADFAHLDIDNLERLGILVDREGDSYLFQKFIKPIGDRPFFLYEIVQRVNGYSGFALKNINILKRAEEMELMK